ncbi:hypothetical protein DPMN_140092 [Dreissena polymorpha]|uniref:Uncharacterized protein n=1 Tax=Dreissena polymorpha TaxID=45954 RepID=A0A9D4GAV8_DREPO|nr:hypothetical protein DPMN_140092 [Dreissena polymorpha]
MVDYQGLVEPVLGGEAYGGAACLQSSPSSHRCSCHGDSYSDLSGAGGTLLGYGCST